jgi:hypothetical protein
MIQITNIGPSPENQSRDPEGEHVYTLRKVGFDLAEKPDATAISIVQMGLDGSQRVHKCKGHISPELSRNHKP